MSMSLVSRIQHTKPYGIW